MDRGDRRSQTDILGADRRCPDTAPVGCELVRGRGRRPHRMAAVASVAGPHLLRVRVTAVGAGTGRPGGRTSERTARACKSGGGAVARSNRKIKLADAFEDLRCRGGYSWSYPTEDNAERRHGLLSASRAYSGILPPIFCEMDTLSTIAYFVHILVPRLCRPSSHGRQGHGRVHHAGPVQQAVHTLKMTRSMPWKRHLACHVPRADMNMLRSSPRSGAVTTHRRCGGTGELGGMKPTSAIPIAAVVAAGAVVAVMPVRVVPSRNSCNPVGVVAVVAVLSAGGATILRLGVPPRAVFGLPVRIVLRGEYRARVRLMPSKVCETRRGVGGALGRRETSLNAGA